MTPANLEQKVRQLDNDVQALYDLIHKISTTQVRHTNRLGEISSDLAAQGARLDSLEGRFDSLEGRFDSLEGRFDSLGGKVDSLEGKVDQILELLRR